MQSADPAGHEQLPEEMMFNITRGPSTQNVARLGLLKLPNRNSIQTPHYIGLTSRGVVPHLSPDNYAKQTDIRGVYTALEDFIEKLPPQEPPVYHFTPPDDASPLRRFTGLPDDSLLVFGARRTLPITCPTSSQPSSISVSTSVGFRQLTIKEYIRAGVKLRPDIIIGPGDIPYGAEKLSNKKTEKITDRTTNWMTEFVKARRDGANGGAVGTKAPLFAPILPIPMESQRWYMEHLLEDMTSEVDGLAIYNTCALENLPAKLDTLPRIGFTEPKSPNAILREVALGVDVMTIPFIGAVTDAGIAMDFCFPIKEELKNAGLPPKALGVDMWHAEHAVDLSPLTPERSCYACTNHHRAFMQHLLAAKEMLGWVLLQIHNHHTMDAFFAGIRESLARGTFEQDTADFQLVYESELPAKTGQGPRVRGYQRRGAGPGQPKLNPTTFKNLKDDPEKLGEASPPTPSLNAEDLEAQGFAEKA